MSYYRKLLFLSLACVMVLCFTAQAYGQQEISQPDTQQTYKGVPVEPVDRQVTVDGISVPFSTPLYLYEGEYYLPAATLMKALRMSVVYERTLRNGIKQVVGMISRDHYFDGIVFEDGPLHITSNDTIGEYQVISIHDIMLLPAHGMTKIFENLTVRTDEESIAFTLPTIVTPRNLQPGLPWHAHYLMRQPTSELEDNRMSDLRSMITEEQIMPPYLEYIEMMPDGSPPDHFLGQLYDSGNKWLSITINSQDWYPDGEGEDYSTSELKVNPIVNFYYTCISNYGINIVYNLIFKDKDFVREGGVLGIPRFKNEAEIQRYLEFVHFTVSHFKGRVKMYEIWNEQDIENSPQNIEVEDYIELVKRAIPVIRAEDPDALISIGQTTGYSNPYSQAYIYALATSELMPLVDALAIHPLFYESPEYRSEYYYAYPGLLDELKQTALDNGFTGIFVGSEGNYCMEALDEPGFEGKPYYSALDVAKYMARGVVTTLAKGFMSGTYSANNTPPAYYAYTSLANLMAGAQPKEISVDVQSEIDLLRCYGFELADGSQYVVLWDDRQADDDFEGTLASITIYGVPENQIPTGIDILTFFEQELAYARNGDQIVIEGFRIPDYPVLIKLNN